MIEKKKLTQSQILRLKKITIGHGNGSAFCELARISVSSLHKARKGKILSYYIIDKIIEKL